MGIVGSENSSLTLESGEELSGESVNNDKNDKLTISAFSPPILASAREARDCLNVDCGYTNSCRDSYGLNGVRAQEFIGLGE